MPLSPLEYCAVALTYSLLAWAILGTLLRLWQIRDPALLFRFRLGILLVPPLAPLLFAPFGPLRSSASFRGQIALLDTQRWLGPEPTLAHPAWMILAVTMVGTTLFLVILELAGAVHRPTTRRGTTVEPPASSHRLESDLARLPDRGADRDEVVVVNRPGVTAFTRGFRRHTIVVSTGLCDLLDSEELQAVLAHEMAHARRRDTRLGLLLFGLRLLSFYNPMALLVFHRMGHDVELLCDAEATATTGNPLALASALIKVYHATGGRPVPRGRFARLAGKAIAIEQHARQALVEDRVERLVHPERLEPACWPDLRLALSIAAVLSLAFLVV